MGTSHRIVVAAAGALSIAGALLLPAALAAPPGAAFQQRAQLPLAPLRATGQTVTPAFEGWYENPDGSFSISFGYYNRNTEELLYIPVGEDNTVSPGGPDRGQPTRFQPGRHWGVFVVRVPADFGNQRVVWTVKIDGETFSIPGHLRSEWKIDALAGEAGAGNTPPVVGLDPAGPEGAGPAGVTAGPLNATAGVPLPLTVWARDDGRPDTSIASGGRENVPVTLTWLEYRGPGGVIFDTPTERVPVGGGEAHTTATFDVPGDYVVRVRANDASGVSGAGHAQCCWTNGFVKVHVTAANSGGGGPAGDGAGAWRKRP